MSKAELEWLRGVIACLRETGKSGYEDFPRTLAWHLEAIAKSGCVDPKSVS